MASYSDKYTLTAPELKDYEAQTLPSYEAQTDRVNQTYDAKQESSIAALKGAYDTSLLEANATLDKIPAAYQKQANVTGAESEKQKQAFNEYAAGRGINSGTGSQAQLAFSNQLQNDLGDIRASQASATANAQLEISKIKTQYQDSVAAAVAQNDYARAAALLGEYQTAAQSVVSVAQAQADELYRAYQSQLANTQYTAEFERTADAEAYDRAKEQADTLAAYGDFSGYYDLGYSADEVAAMQSYWNRMNTPSYSYGGSSRSYSSGSSGSSGSSSSSSLYGSTSASAASSAGLNPDNSAAAMQRAAARYGNSGIKSVYDYSPSSGLTNIYASGLMFK